MKVCKKKEILFAMFLFIYFPFAHITHICIVPETQMYTHGREMFAFYYQNNLVIFTVKSVDSTSLNFAFVNNFVWQFASVDCVPEALSLSLPFCYSRPRLDDNQNKSRNEILNPVQRARNRLLYNFINIICCNHKQCACQSFCLVVC